MFCLRMFPLPRFCNAFDAVQSFEGSGKGRNQFGVHESLSKLQIVGTHVSLNLIQVVHKPETRSMADPVRFSAAVNYCMAPGFSNRSVNLPLTPP